MMYAVQHMADCATGGSWRVSDRQSALKALLHRMGNADQNAAAALYDETSGLLYSLAVRIVTNVEDAEEVMHDVYCRAWRNATSYDESRGSVMSWLVLMTRSAAIDLVRSKRRTSCMVPLDYAAQAKDSSERSPDVQASTRETATRVQSALASLPVEQRQAVELAFFSGLTHSELADHLNVPLGTVKTRVRSGLLRLRGLLEGLET
jgi:RNA polymerase sigma-70 factor (ECF subfamily)